MCVSCHGRPDPDFPSSLTLLIEPGRCGACHMEIENLDVSWVRDADRAVLVSVVGEGAAAAAAGEVRALIEAELERRGFRISSDAAAASWARLTLRLEVRGDARFLPAGTPVRVASLEAVVGVPGEPGPLFRRLAVSRPEHGATAGHASSRAARDAWRILSTHLIEALACFGTD